MQFPQDDAIPLNPRGDIRHIVKYMKSIYGDAIALLTQDLFDSLKGQTVYIKYFSHGQEMQRTTDYIFPLHLVGNIYTDPAVGRLVGELVRNKKVAKYKMDSRNLVRFAKKKYGYFTLASIDYNHIDYVQVDGNEEARWLEGSETVMCPGMHSIAFVFLKAI